VWGFLAAKLSSGEAQKRNREEKGQRGEERETCEKTLKKFGGAQDDVFKIEQ